MNLKCTSNAINLTVGKVYHCEPCTIEEKPYYHVKNDTGCYGFYDRHNFEEVTIRHAMEVLH